MDAVLALLKEDPRTALIMAGLLAFYALTAINALRYNDIDRHL